jgi:hypothetical protein
MAHVSEEVIAKARTALKVLNKEFGVKSTLSGKGGSTLHLTIAEGRIDFIANYLQNINDKRAQYYYDTDWIIDSVTKKQNIGVNHYHLDSLFSGIALEYLEKAKEIMHADHWDKSDIMTDYFYCAYYVNMSIGRWNKPYRYLLG